MPVIEMLHIPLRFPLSGCNRYPGRSGSPGLLAASKSAGRTAVKSGHHLALDKIQGHLDDGEPGALRQDAGNEPRSPVLAMRHLIGGQRFDCFFGCAGLDVQAAPALLHELVASLELITNSSHPAPLLSPGFSNRVLCLASVICPQALGPEEWRNCVKRHPLQCGVLPDQGSEGQGEVGNCGHGVPGVPRLSCCGHEAAP